MYARMNVRKRLSVIGLAAWLAACDGSSFGGLGGRNGDFAGISLAPGVGEDASPHFACGIVAPSAVVTNVETSQAAVPQDVLSPV